MTTRERAAWATVLTGIIASAFSGAAAGPIVFGVGLVAGCAIGFIAALSLAAYLGSEQRRLQ